MGSGSSGGGGGGSGGSGGTGAGGGRGGSGRASKNASLRGYGGFSFNNGKIRSEATDAGTKSAALRHVMGKLRHEYLTAQFLNGAAGDVYGNLRLVGVELRQNKSWNAIGQKFGVDGEEGCLPRLSAAVMREAATPGLDERCRKVVRLALEDILLRVANDDPDYYETSTGRALAASCDGSVFDRLANLFLGSLVYEVARAEEAALPKEARLGLRAAALGRADEIVRRFEAEFKDKPFGKIAQVSYGSMFEVFKSKPDWFLKEIRR